MTNTIQSRVTAADYAAIDALNISRLKELGRSPLHYQHALQHPKMSRPLSLGTAAHCATLEPERFAEQFAIWARRSENTGNLCPRNGQHWERFQAASAGKTIITEDECIPALNLAHAVRSDPIAAKYLEFGEPEVVLSWQLDYGDRSRPCKGRIDWLTKDGDEPVLVGLKTARDCRPFIFGSAAAKYGYHLQWAWYADGHQKIRGKQPRVIEIVVESAAPHAVVVYEIPDEVLVQGREEYMKLLEQLDTCERTNIWPGPATEPQILSLPTWAYRAEDDISELGLEN